MPITTEDQVIAGLQPPIAFHKATFTGEAAGYFHNLASVVGNPSACVLAAPGMAGAIVDNTSAIGGMLSFANPGAGLDAHLAKLSVSIGANIIGFLLYDMLWYQSGIVVATTTPQTVNSIAFPPRSIIGTTNGQGVEIFMHSNVTTTNAGIINNSTISYTNSAGTSGRVGALNPNWPATAVAGTFVPFTLQGSDIGVQSVQSVTLGTSYAGGTVNLIAARRVAFIPFVSATSGALLDWASLGFPRLWNGSALYMAALLSGTAGGHTTGDIAYAHG